MKTTIHQTTRRVIYTTVGIAALVLAACGQNNGSNGTGTTEGSGQTTGSASGSGSSTGTAAPTGGTGGAGDGNVAVNPNAAGNGNTMANPNGVANGNSTFDPNALKFAYFGTEVSGTQGLVAVIVSADANLCTSGKFGPVQEGSVDLSGIATCSGTNCTNVTMTVQVDTHPAAATAGMCALYGDKADGSASVKGSAKLTGSTASITLTGSVADPNNPNTPISFDYSLTPKSCQFPITATPAASDTVSCTP